jgi:O-antigen ligase
MTSISRVPSKKNTAKSASTWLAALTYIFLILEGTFKILIETKFSDGVAFWSKIFPVNLFPSEALFVAVGLPLSVLLIPRAFTCRPMSAWLILTGILFIFSFTQMMHGLQNEAGNNAYTSFKSFGFKLLFVPLFAAAAMSANTDRALGIVWRFSSVFSVYVIIYGLAMVVHGNIITKDPLSANFTGSQLMILPMIFGFVMYRSTKRITWLLGSGLIWISTIIPLEKPAITTSMLSVAISWIAIFFTRPGRRSSGSSGLGACLGISAVGLIAVIAAYYALELYSEGQWIDYLESRFFKIGLRNDDVSSGRFLMWEWAFEMWLQSPIYGHGIGVLYPAQHAFVPVHNIPIELLYSTGVFGFFLYYYWALGPLWAGWKVTSLVTPDSRTSIVTMTVWLTVVNLANLFGNTTSVQTMSFAYVGCTVFLAVATSRQLRV